MTVTQARQLIGEVQSSADKQVGAAQKEEEKRRDEAQQRELIAAWTEYHSAQIQRATANLFALVAYHKTELRKLKGVD